MTHLVAAVAWLVVLLVAVAVLTLCVVGGIAMSNAWRIRRAKKRIFQLIDRQERAIQRVNVDLQRIVEPDARD